LADAGELVAHELRLQKLAAASKGKCLWLAEMLEAVVA